MTPITVTEIIGTEIMMVKVILTGVDDGTIIVEVKDIVIVEEVDDGILVSNIITPGTTRNPNFKTQITIDRLPWDINTDTQSHMVNTHTSPSNNSTKRAIQIDTDKYEYDNSSGRTDNTNSSQRAEDEYNSQRADDDDENDILHTPVSHVQLPKNGEKYHDNHDDNTLRKMVYGPTYVPYNEDGQKILLPQTTDMSRKDNLKLLYNSLPEGMCDNEYESLEQAVNDVETFQYSHETSTQHVLVQGVYIGSASPLIADIKTQPYSMLTYLDNGMMTGTYDNTHDIPIYIDNGSTLNIMPTHFYDKAYYLHHLPKAPTAAKTILTGNGPVKTHFWIDVLLNVQGCMIQLKLLVCDTQAQTGILLSKMALEQLQTWQDYSNNTLYVKQTAVPLHAIQNIELLPDRKTTIELIADKTNDLQYKDIIGGQGIVWV